MGLWSRWRSGLTEDSFPTYFLDSLYRVRTKYEDPRFDIHWGSVGTWKLGRSKGVPRLSLFWTLPCLVEVTSRRYLRVRSPYVTFTPYVGRCSGQVLPTLCRKTTSETSYGGEGGSSDLVDLFLCVLCCVTVTCLSLGCTGSSSRPLPK